jgi:hypothetical protein
VTVLIRNPFAENVPKKPCNHPFSVFSVFSVAVGSVSENVSAVSETKQPVIVPDTLTGVTGTSEPGKVLIALTRCGVSVTVEGDGLFVDPISAWSVASRTLALLMYRNRCEL